MELVSHQLGRGGIQDLVDGGHDPQLEQRLDHLAGLVAHGCGQLAPPSPTPGSLISSRLISTGGSGGPGLCSGIGGSGLTSTLAGAAGTTGATAAGRAGMTRSGGP